MSGAWRICAVVAALVSSAGPAAAQSSLDQPPGTVLEPPSGAPGTGERPRFHLQPTREGGYVYDGTQFSARIAPDGTVSFDTHHFQLSPDGPDPSSVGIDAVTPQVPISGQFPPAIESRPGFRFDVTDEYLRLVGQDPARVEKANFLAATFDLRMDMVTRAQRARQQSAAGALPAQLAQLWQDPRFTATERVRLLQGMWNDLDSGPQAEPAREIIRAFARAHLSAGEAAGFR